MKEIKLIIGRGGKVKILAKGTKGKGSEQFTEKLAKDLGEIEERHKGNTYEINEQGQSQSQSH